MKKISFICMLLILSTTFIWAQVYQNSCKNENLKTLTIYPDGKWTGIPVIGLQTENRIQISFDELSHDYKQYAYRIIHCTADWKRSDLNVLEYLDGFQENDVDSAEQSISTLTLYTHYSFCLPNEHVKLLLSGNYAVEVFEKYGNGETLLTACFSISENKVVIDAQVTANTDIDFQDRHQQVNFSLRPVGLTVNQPLQDFKVVVQQNRRRDTEVRNLTPISVTGNSLLFEHEKRLIFEGGNEYRRFEATTYKYPGLNVNRVEFFKPFYNVELLPSEKRTTGYTFDKDQDGRFLVHGQEAQDDRTGADYYLVHFSIPMLEPTMDAAFFLNGDFVQNRQDATSKLIYDFERKAYLKSILLKQGAYNYQYVCRQSGSSTVSAYRMEGSYWQTENEYQIYVYYHPAGERYDRLIGIREIRTGF